MGKLLSQTTEKSIQRAVLKNLGLTDDEIAKPVIAIVSSRSEGASGGLYVTAIEDAVKAGIYQAGGVPVVIPCTSFFSQLASGTAGARYSIPSREIVADSVESILMPQAFEGAVFIPSDAESIAGMAMGGVRANTPFLVITAGPMASGFVKSKKAGLSSAAAGAGGLKNGKLSLEELSLAESSSMPGPGTQNGLYHENSLVASFEALGIALPKTATAPALSSERIRLAKYAGDRIVTLVNEDIRPKMIISPASFDNALLCLSAMNSSTAAVIDLIAIAAEAGIEISLDKLQQIATTTPLLVNLFPDSSQDMDDFHNAGGVPALLGELSKGGQIHADCRTVSVGMRSASIEGAETLNGDVIREFASPAAKRGGFTLLKGNLAEDGAIIKTPKYERKTSLFKGSAVCFECEEDAVNAILNGNVNEGDVVIIRYEGPVGGPGMRKVSAAAAAIDGAGLTGKVALVTDGRLEGVEKGICVGCVSPEAALGGKIAVVNNGDTIKIDTANYKLDIDITMKDLLARMKKSHPHTNTASDYLLRYASMAQPAFKGAGYKKNGKRR